MCVQSEALAAFGACMELMPSLCCYWKRRAASVPRRPVSGNASEAAKDIEERLAKLSPPDEVNPLLHDLFSFSTIMRFIVFKALPREQVLGALSLFRRTSVCYYISNCVQR